MINSKYVTQKMKHRDELKYIVVPTFLILGIAAGLVREILIAKYYGISEQADIFRVAFALPNLLSFTVGTAFVSALLTLMIKEKKEFLAISDTSNVIIIGLLIVGVLTSEFQAHFLAPGFNERQLENLAVQSIICWLMFGFIGFAFPMRAQLNANNVLWPSASVNFIRAFAFSIGLIVISAINETTFIKNNTLSIVAVISGSAVLFSHIYAMKKCKKCTMVRIVDVKNIHFDQKILWFLFLSTTYQFLSTAPSFVDRAYASTLQIGNISAFEYSSSIVVMFAMILSNTFIIILLPKYIKNPEEKKYIQAFIFLMVLALSISFILFHYAEDLVRLIFSRGEFNKEAIRMTSIVLRWQGVGLAILIANSILSQVILISDLRKYLLVIGGVKLLFKLISMEYIVEKFGLAGIGISFTLVESVTLLLFFLAIGLIKKKPDYNRR